MSPNNYCSSCGHPHVPGALFCGRCGHGVDGAVPGGAQTPGVPASGEIGGEASSGSSGDLSHRAEWRLPVPVLLIGGVVLLLALVGALGAALLLQDGSSSTPISATAAPTGTAEAVPTPGASEGLEGDTETRVIRCWDDNPAEGYSACPALRGVAAMRWLFPGLARDFSSCEPASAYDGKLRAYACTVEGAGNRSARVVYSEWTSFALGDSHYRRKYGSPESRAGGFNIWDTVYVSERFQTSRMYSSSLPFSVTVASKSEQLATEVMNRLEIRSSSTTERYVK